MTFQYLTVSCIYIPAKVMYQTLSRCVTETYQVLFVDVIDRTGAFPCLPMCRPFGMFHKSLKPLVEEG